MSVIKLISADKFNTFVKSSDLSVIHFFAPWADQCIQMNEVLEEMVHLEEYKSVQFANIVAEDFPEISVKYNITAVPTTLLIRTQKVVERIDGANPSEVREKIQKQLLDKSNSHVDELLDKLISTRIGTLINKSPCMLFMKGDRNTPACQFSRKIIDLLEQHTADYETFNILEDNDIREGLKKYSNWPTYPQLYIKGELIGGLDIVKEMIETGELDNILPKKSENLESKLKKLINQAPCMLFMKGNKHTPVCGFSKAIVSLLDKHKVNYETFDILGDNEVREGLKLYSNWPTYPQLYVDGELVGGLDIVKEMSDSGILDDILPN